MSPSCERRNISVDVYSELSVDSTNFRNSFDFYFLKKDYLKSSLSQIKHYLTYFTRLSRV